MVKRIVAAMILLIVVLALLSPFGSAMMAVKVVEIAGAWILASIVVRIITKKSLTSLIFGDDDK